MLETTLVLLTGVLLGYFSHQPDNKKLPEAPQILMEKPQPLSYPKSWEQQVVGLNNTTPVKQN
jgi:hypothetical protein